MLQHEGRREYVKHVMKGAKKTTQNTLRKTRNGKDVVSLRGFSKTLSTPQSTLINKIKAVPYFYIHILVHLFYQHRLRLSELSRILERPVPNVQTSLFRMLDINLIARDEEGYFYLTVKGRNEIEALRYMLFK